MNKKQSKQQLVIPGFVWAIAVIIILCIVFMFLVQAPFSEKIDKYNADHASAQSQIALFEDYLARADEVEAKIAKMKEEYNEESKKLHVNATEFPNDVRNMVNQLNIQLDSVSSSEGSTDSAGRVSSTGDPLYVSTISLAFSGTEADLPSALDYFEIESDGSYYVESLTVTEITGSSAVKSTEPRFNIGLSLSLYFFPPKVDETESMSPIVSGSDAAVSLSSSASSASSAA